MATKKSSTTTKVTRISADEKAPKKAAPVKKTVKTETVRETTSRRSPWRAIKDYFGGSWYELREVRWPTRSATWGMVGALLGFTAFFVVLVLLIDALFQWIFNLVLGS